MIILDLETVPNADAIKTPQWKRKQLGYEKRGKVLEDSDACFNPVFGQIICFCGASIIGDKYLFNGSLNNIDGDEESLIEDVHEFLMEHEQEGLLAHNGIGFDFPYLMKKFMHYGLKAPNQLQILNKKPWERMLFDTMEALKCDAWGNATSLDEACFLLDVPTPKDTFTSATVWDEWKDGNEQYILDGCVGDVDSTIGVWKKLNKLGVM